MDNQNRQIDKLYQDYIFIEENLEFHKQNGIPEERINAVRNKIDEMIEKRMKNVKHDAANLMVKLLYDEMYKTGEYDKYISL